MNLYDRIKARRLELRLSQDELAQKLGYKSRSTINKKEMGKNYITQSKIKAFAEALETTPSYLMGWEDEEGNSTLEKKYDNIVPITTYKVPLLGEIACGKPIFANQDLECYIDVTTNINADFALKAKGDSMINARIYDGDIVFIRKQCDVEDGEIAAVIIEDEATLKRVYKDTNTITLVAENAKYKPIVYRSGDCVNVRILGKAIAFQSDVI